MSDQDQRCGRADVRGSVLSLAEGFGEGGEDGSLNRRLGFIAGYPENEISLRRRRRKKKRKKKNRKGDRIVFTWRMSPRQLCHRRTPSNLVRWRIERNCISRGLWLNSNS